MASLELGFIHQIGPTGLIVLLVLALIIFGKRLPDVARNLGKGIVEFKKGVRGIEDEVDSAAHSSATPSARYDRGYDESGYSRSESAGGEPASTSSASTSSPSSSSPTPKD